MPDVRNSKTAKKNNARISHSDKFKMEPLSLCLARSLTHLRYLLTNTYRLCLSLSKYM